MPALVRACQTRSLIPKLMRRSKRRPLWNDWSASSSISSMAELRRTVPVGRGGRSISSRFEVRPTAQTLPPALALIVNSPEHRNLRSVPTGAGIVLEGFKTDRYRLNALADQRNHPNIGPDAQDSQPAYTRHHGPQRRHHPHNADWAEDAYDHATIADTLLSAAIALVRLELPVKPGLLAVPPPAAPLHVEQPPTWPSRTQPARKRPVTRKARSKRPEYPSPPPALVDD